VSDTTRIVVLGPGAMGCLFSALLTRGGADVVLLDRNPDRARLINDRGLILEQGGRSETIAVRATADPAAAGPAGLVIVCVKAYDTAAAAGAAAAAAGPGADVLSLQNGVGNVEALVAALGAGRVLGGTTAQGANLVGPGHVRHAGTGETVIGEPGGGDRRARRAAAVFEAGGVPARATDDLEALIWSKVAINAAINPLTALLKVRNGALAELPAARALMEAAAAEAAAVAAARGIKLLYPDARARAAEVARATAENISSMHADARAQRRTEIEQINGAVAAEAERLSVPAPVNAALTALVRALEESYGRTV
jgi:2-dehydropantoate 2-reductase